MAGRLKVFIAGAGRMGEILARSISERHEVAVFDLDEGKARQLAARAGCVYGTPGERLSGSDVLVLALPPAATARALESMTGFLQPGAVVINIATTVFKEELRPMLEGRVHLVGAKIVGHYREMKERPVIIIDADDEKGSQTAGLLFSGIGVPAAGDERLVGMINTVATREAFRAAVRIQDLLREAGAGPELIDSALRVVAAGSIKSYAEGDLGPFALELVKEIRSDS